MPTRNRKSVQSHAEAILADLREYGSVTREFVKQKFFISDDGYADQIIHRAFLLGKGAVERTPKGNLIWKPAPRGRNHATFDATDRVPAAQEQHRAKLRGEAWT